MSRILLADDDPQLLALRARLLEDSGHQVYAAMRPSDAMRHLANAEVVIMDLRFPGPNGHPDPSEGLGLIRDIRASGYRGPVIVLCGWMQDLEGTAEERLVSRAIQKPVTMDALLEAVTASL